IVTWRVAVGDEIKVNDILVEIETSKSLVELPSPYQGTVTGLLVSEGDTVDVGVPIIAIDDGSGQVANLVGYGPKPTDSRRRPRRTLTTEADPVEAHEQVNSTFAITSP